MLRGLGRGTWQQACRANVARRWASGIDGFSFPGPRALKHIVKLPLLMREPRENVEDIWKRHHEGHKTAVAEVMKPGNYQILRMRAKRCPWFLLPVYNQRQTGHYMVFLQWQDQHCLITYLEDYRRLGSAAQPYMIISLFDDILEAKDLALLRGEIFTDKLTRDDALKILANLKKFYLGEETNFQQVIKFNESPNEFSLEDVLTKSRSALVL